MSSKRLQILRAARNVFGKFGYHATNIDHLTQTSGLSKGILQEYFHNKESLLMATQKAIFKELHQRITERTLQNQKGVATALDALDSMWNSIRSLHHTAPFIVETLNLRGKESPLQEEIKQFYTESTNLLEDGIRTVFGNHLATLVIPPERMAILIRILLSGLVVELAGCTTDSELKEVDQAFADFRSLFEQFVVQEFDWDIDEETDSVPLPW